jgi:hypothetical protein
VPAVGRLRRSGAATSADGPLVGKAEQLDHRLNAGVADCDGHPSGVREDVMWPGSTSGDQLVTDPARKRQVGDPVAVEVPELTTTDSELDPTEAMWRGLHAGPRRHYICDALRRVWQLLCHRRLSVSPCD